VSPAEIAVAAIDGRGVTARRARLRPHPCCRNSLELERLQRASSARAAMAIVVAQAPYRAICFDFGELRLQMPAFRTVEIGCGPR